MTTPNLIKYFLKQGFGKTNRLNFGKKDVEGDVYRPKNKVLRRRRTNSTIGVFMLKRVHSLGFLSMLFSPAILLWKCAHPDTQYVSVRRTPTGSSQKGTYLEIDQISWYRHRFYIRKNSDLVSKFF